MDGPSQSLSDMFPELTVRDLFFETIYPYWLDREELKGSAGIR